MKYKTKELLILIVLLLIVCSNKTYSQTIKDSVGCLTHNDKIVLNILHSVERQCDSLSKQKDTVIQIQDGLIKVGENMHKLDSMKIYELNVKVSNRDVIISDLEKKNKQLVFWNVVLKIATAVSLTLLLIK